MSALTSAGSQQLPEIGVIQGPSGSDYMADVRSWA
jgi:hypothetical protein